MKIVLDTNDVKAALHAHVENMGILKPGMDVTMTINKLRAADEISVEIEIVPQEEAGDGTSNAKQPAKALTEEPDPAKVAEAKKARAAAKKAEAAKKAKVGADQTAPEAPENADTGKEAPKPGGKSLQEQLNHNAKQKDTDPVDPAATEETTAATEEVAVNPFA